MQERPNSIANALELRLSCTNRSKLLFQDNNVKHQFEEKNKFKEKQTLNFISTISPLQGSLPCPQLPAGMADLMVSPPSNQQEFGGKINLLANSLTHLPRPHFYQTGSA